MEAPSRQQEEQQHQQAGGSSQDPAPTGEASAAAKQAVAFAPKRNRNRGNLRKRTAEEGGGEDDEGDPTRVARGKAARGEQGLAFTSKQGASDEVQVTYESSRALQSGQDTRVTSHLETETEVTRDARCGE